MLSLCKLVCSIIFIQSHDYWWCRTSCVLCEIASSFHEACKINETISCVLLKWIWDVLSHIEAVHLDISEIDMRVLGYRRAIYLDLTSGGSCEMWFMPATDKSFFSPIVSVMWADFLAHLMSRTPEDGNLFRFWDLSGWCAALQDA